MGSGLKSKKSKKDERMIYAANIRTRKKIVSDDAPHDLCKEGRCVPNPRPTKLPKRIKICTAASQISALGEERKYHAYVTALRYIPRYTMRALISVPSGSTPHPSTWANIRGYRGRAPKRGEGKRQRLAACSPTFTKQDCCVRLSTVSSNAGTPSTHPTSSSYSSPRKKQGAKTHLAFPFPPVSSPFPQSRINLVAIRAKPDDKEKRRS
ncbi:hypothetical protein B0H13DRAFT_2431797 [Mycena leptocephala]|nr:hypothetical protein B0H13DRAFT_2431797 [Mycena leptocephala]